MKNRWVRRLVLLVVLVAVAVVLRYVAFRPEQVPVTVFRVASGVVEETVTNSKAGTVKTRRRAKLSPEIGGRVERLPIREGDRVARGQILMELAADDFRAQVRLRERALEAAEAARVEACANAQQAANDLERYGRLARDAVVSEELLEQTRTRHEAAVSGCDGAQARVLEARAALDVARVDLSKTVLRAPFDGVVAELSTEVGEWITPSPPGVPIPAVVEVLDRDRIYVSAPLDEVDTGRVRVGLPVRVTLDAYPDQEFPGTLTRIAPYVLDIEEQNRTFEIEVELADASFAALLLPGSSADVEVILDEHRDVLRIPSYALIEGHRVLVVEDGKLVSRDVETGLSNWEFAEVVTGLSEGELVVVSLDRAEVQAGARARVTDETLK